MASMTKKEFAEMVRAVKTTDGEVDPELLEGLSQDLHYVEVLARGYSEDALKKLETDPNERFW